MSGLYRQPVPWNQHTARTGGAGSFVGTDDIWCRFRDPSELVSREAFAEDVPAASGIQRGTTLPRLWFGSCSEEDWSRGVEAVELGSGCTHNRRPRWRSGCAA